jgi:RNA polymerase sigma-70 factor, ECF subfamily
MEMEAARPVNFETIYDQHFDFVWRVLRRLGCEQDEVEDAVQDVFLVVHKRLSSFEGRSKMTTWLFSICVNIQRERARKRAPTQPLSSEMELATFAEGLDGPAWIERKQEARLLEALLQDIPQPQRTTFIMYELEEMDGPDIAQHLGVPLGTVRSRLRLARESFRAAFNKVKTDDSWFLRLKGGMLAWMI